MYVDVQASDKELTMIKFLTVVAMMAFGFFSAIVVAEVEVEYRPGGPNFAKVWNQFYAEPGHEPDLDDPLINAGRKMTSMICEAIKHTDMKRRRYAIGALGFIEDKRALPTLEGILKDKNEKDYFRGDALKAIYQIDEGLGTTYANEFIESNNYLKLISKAILRKESWLKEPTEED